MDLGGFPPMQHLRNRTASMKTSVELVLTIVTNTAHVLTLKVVSRVPAQSSDTMETESRVHRYVVTVGRCQRKTAMTAMQILEMDALHPVPLNQEPYAGR